MKSSMADHLERMNRVQRYIQEHVGETLRLEIVARVACYSPFHFHRIFQAYAGETLNAYVRRLRLERAAHQLCHSRREVTDIALDAGYETPSAFTKAFTQHFGRSPSTFRKSNSVYLLQQQTIVIQPRKEKRNMKPEIREREDVKVLYVRRVGKYSQSAGEAWPAVCAYAGPRGLLNERTEFIGISHDDPGITPEDKLRYDACVTIQGDAQPEGEVGVQTLAGGKFAVFTHRGPYDGLNNTYQQIYGQWLPESGVQLREQSCFEKYLNDCTSTPPEDLLTEIFIPIQ